MKAIVLAIAAAVAGLGCGLLLTPARADTPGLLSGAGGAAAGFSGQEGCIVITTQDGPSAWIPELIVIRDKKIYRIRLDAEPPKELKPWGQLDR